MIGSILIFFFKGKNVKEKNPWCRSIVFWFHVKLWILSPGIANGQMSETSLGIMPSCSRHARTETWWEHSQFHVMFSAGYTWHHGMFFFSPFFSLCFVPTIFSYWYLGRLPILFSVLLLFLQVWKKKKSSKFESEGRIAGNSLLNHGFFPFNKYFLWIFPSHFF